MVAIFRSLAVLAVFATSVLAHGPEVSYIADENMPKLFVDFYRFETSDCTDLGYPQQDIQFRPLELRANICWTFMDPYTYTFNSYLYKPHDVLDATRPDCYVTVWDKNRCEGENQTLRNTHESFNSCLQFKTPVSVSVTCDGKGIEKYVRLKGINAYPLGFEE